ncbi:glutathione S-transferase Mu 1 [Nematostella vectensis]|uniref:glutathione S-transferase Mu 1 n=1 Tax=Nematostella vectensis TaxID=45351 RepID=UPI00139042CE|nr:glutathione S-transferase Mu 1 [Nematostella vectensis]
MAPVPILGYWPIRGLGQPIRLLLKYTNEDFEDKRYALASGGKQNEWFIEKYNLGLDFPNLPYFIDGDIMITQSNAILRYIARRHNMCGKTKKEMVIVDMLENQLMDFRNNFITLTYRDRQNYEKNKAVYLKDIKAVIKRFADFLGEKTYLAGEELTFVDFVMYELMDHHRLFEPSLLQPHENLKMFLNRIEQLPAVAEYMKSEEFIHRPINAPFASFY